MENSLKYIVVLSKKHHASKLNKHNDCNLGQQSDRRLADLEKGNMTT